MTRTSGDGRSPFPSPAHDHGACASDLMARAEGICARRGSRLTKLRRTVLEAVGSSHRAAGAYEIIDRMAERGPRPAPISVYRALDFLATHGLVHKIESLNAFVACTLTHQAPDAILLICEGCGRVAEMEGERTFETLAKRAAASGFQTRQTVVEMSGRCAHCASGTAA